MSMMSRWRSLIARPTNCPRSVPKTSVPVCEVAFSIDASSSLSSLMRGGVALPGLVLWRPSKRASGGGARRAIGPKFVPEACRIEPALRLIEGVRIGFEGLDLLDQSGNVAGEAVILDRGRHLPEMVAVL